MNSDTIYEQLRQKIDKMPVGMPATESGVEIKILKNLFTPEEAKIALMLNIVPESIETIYKRIKKEEKAINIERVEEMLDNLVWKGAIMPIEEKGKKCYSLAQFAIGMFEFQVDRLTKEEALHYEQYTRNEFAKEFHRTQIPQLRIVPVNKSIRPEKLVATYDDIREVVQRKEGLFGVRNCVCRQTKDLIGEPCKTTTIRETCITFPSESPLFKRFEPDRLISKEETLELLEKAEKAGLLIQPGNTKDPDFICCCCGDCCGVLTMAKQFPKPAELFSGNYYAEVNSEVCTGCGTCIDRCQMEAINFDDGRSIIELTRCIGCGLCVPTCPEGAIALQRKERANIPPEKPIDLYKKILIKKHGRIRTLKFVITNKTLVKKGLKSILK